MKLIEPKAELILQQEGLEGVYKQIEIAGRVCYHSENRITEDSAKGFVDRMIKSNHCYTGDSEVLTEYGWVKWKDYQGQKVAVINPDLSFKGFELPQRVLSQTYAGKFYEYPSLGIKVTDGHKMFGVFRLGDNDFYNSSNYDFFNCNSEFVDNNGRHKTDGERMFKTPRHCLKPLSTNPYMELVGFWLGDGCYLKTAKNELVFHLKKQRKIKYLKELAERLGWAFVVGKSNYYRIKQENIGEIFNKLYHSGGKSISIIPNSAETVHSIITGLINSDGSYGTNTKTITYTSVSKSIIDWICNYAPLGGYTVSYRGIHNNNNSSIHKVLLLATDYTLCNDSRLKKSKVVITEDTEKVYCVTVSTGLIMVKGYNGITTICGNCAMLEHGTVYLDMPITPEDVCKYSVNPYSKARVLGDRLLVTTNCRVIKENKWDSDLNYLCSPTEHHEKRYTLKLRTDRAIMAEITRHRVFSYAIESTRYCNYSKSKFGGEVTFILPYGLLNREYDKFVDALKDAEKYYFTLLDQGWTPQEARQVLPNALKTEICMTGFESDWKHFFDLRLYGTTGAPHPDMKALAELAMQEFDVIGLADKLTRSEEQIITLKAQAVETYKKYIGK